MFRRGEHGRYQFPEPTPLGYQVDPASAALYEEFTTSVATNYRAIYDIWIDPDVTNQTIHQRALTVITAPRGLKLPYYQPDQSISALKSVTEEISGEKTTSLRARMAGRPELAEELAVAVIFWMDTTGGMVGGDRYDSRYDYMDIMQALIPVVSDDTAESLFSHFPINDPEPYWNLDTASGYNPLIGMLHDKGIPSKYKELGLAKWFEVARQEEFGKEQPREEHERAVKTMRSFLEIASHGQDIDDSIFTSIIAFLEKTIPPTESIVATYATERIARCINDEDIKFVFVWRQVVGDGGEDGPSFRVHDQDDIALLNWMTQQAEKRGMTGSRSITDKLIEEFMIKQREVAESHLAKAAVARELLDRIHSA